MTFYTTVCCKDGARVAMVKDDGSLEYFIGYDFMGSIDWTEDSAEAAVMGMEEAGQIVSDLESSDDEIMAEKAKEAAFEQIENRRNELNNLISETGLTDEIDQEWKTLNDQENKLEMKYYAIATGQNDNVIVFVRSLYEAGWAVQTKANDEWGFESFQSIMDAMKKFASFAREHGIKTVHLESWLLSIEALKETDKQHEEWLDKDEYYTAASYADYYGDDTPLERYYRRHGIEYYAD